MFAEIRQSRQHTATSNEEIATAAEHTATSNEEIATAADDLLSVTADDTSDSGSTNKVYKKMMCF